MFIYPFSLRYVHLQSEISLSDAIAKVKQLTGLPHVRLALAKGKSLEDKINTVALCAGSGASVLKGINADLYLTGMLNISLATCSSIEQVYIFSREN